MCKVSAEREYPLLYQVSTRTWLRELGGERVLSLDEVEDGVLDGWAEKGFDWIYLLGVWEIGAASVAIAREHMDLCEEYSHALPDYDPEDVQGSPFSITAYRVRDELGGDKAMERFRERLHARGMKLMVDFVPNHTARDHPWTRERPELYVQGSASRLEREPSDWFRVETRYGPRVLAHGKDPNFPGWSDTAQLDPRLLACQEAVCRELLGVAARADGMRCDMAMLLLPDVFERIWGDRAPPVEGLPRADRSFWKFALPRLRARFPEVLMMAEVYWDLEYRLQELGFDYTYDKRLCDRLRSGDISGVRAHLRAGAKFQRRLARFVENHDEPRVAAWAKPERVGACILVALTLPGLRFVHDGQIEGHRVLLPVQLARRPEEPVDEGLVAFHARLFEVLAAPELRQGTWRLGHVREASEGNETWRGFVTCTWEHASGAASLVVANLGTTRGQCFTTVPLSHLEGLGLELVDRLGTKRCLRGGDELRDRGLYLDLPPGGCHVFALERR